MLDHIANCIAHHNYFTMVTEVLNALNYIKQSMTSLKYVNAILSYGDVNSVI